MEMDSRLEPASSGPLRNCSFWLFSVGFIFQTWRQSCQHMTRHCGGQSLANVFSLNNRLHLKSFQCLHFYGPFQCFKKNITCKPAIFCVSRHPPLIINISMWHNIISFYQSPPETYTAISPLAKINYYLSLEQEIKRINQTFTVGDIVE